MSKKIKTTSGIPGYTLIKQAGGIEEYQLKANGLRVLYLNRKDTGIVTTNITYFVGARDEAKGETGVAHMLEHMLFKPTTFDVERGVKSGSGAAFEFERNTGCLINANTWKDRTTYYFSYPTKFMAEALQIEAERMNGVILTDKELKPEQGNVLSEFDMYNGDPSFALAVQMCSTAFHSHPYGHETIGYREDIEDYTAEKLEKFYRSYYRPDNAVMMVVGDIDKTVALNTVKKLFGTVNNPPTPIPRFKIREPKQEGIRRIAVERPSTTNIVSIGFKHDGFPTDDWFTTSIMLDTLVSGPESVLHKLLVDTGKASSVNSIIEPTSEANLALINITLSPGQSHDEIERLTLKAISTLDTKTLTPLIKKIKEQVITAELFARQHSLKIIQELTEYTSAGSWETYTKTTEILSQITPQKVHRMRQSSFISNNMTIGHFIGKE